MAAPSDDDADDADGDPHCSHGPRTGLDFLRGPVSEHAPRHLPERSDESEGWMYPVRKAAQISPPHQPQAEGEDGGWQRPERDEAEPVVHDFIASTEMISEVPESSNSVSLKKRWYTQSTLGYGGGSPLVKPAPPPPPVVTPSPSPLKQTPAERAEAKFLEAQRNYITKWLPQFDWLLLDKGDDGLPCLRCSVCSEHGPDNARYGRNGSGGRDLQPASMRAHQASSRHHDCIDRQKGLLDKLAAQKKINDYERADPEGARVTRLMRSIQFVCDEDAPIAIHGFTEMVKAMCTYQQQQQLMYIHASPWIGISCDESTDRLRGKHLVVFATFMKERAVVTEFLALLTIHKCDAGSLFAVLLSHLDNIGIDLQRIVAVSTDGAGVMIGSQSGLVVRLPLTMLWLALGDSIAREDLQRRMRVSCGCGQIRDCCFGRAAAVTSSLDSLRAATPCARLLFMAPVAIGSSDWRTTAAACAPLHYIACGGFCWCAPSPCHFGRPCASVAASALRHLALGSSWWRTAAAPDGPLLLLLAAHCCYSWQRTTFSFLPSCNWYISTWRLLLHLAAGLASGGCFCKRLPAPPDWWQQHHLVACSSSPDALQHLKPCSTGPAAVLPDALAACTGAAPALGGSGISSTCVPLVSIPSSA
ncbi:unnamed protein product [Closterium sp. NIES-54]